MNWYIDALKKYAVLDGRASRKAYWMFVLIHGLIFVGLGLLARSIGLQDEGVHHVTVAYYCATLIPFLTLIVRRMHDVGRSGLWIFFAPVAGIFTLLDSQPGENEYGKNPKEALTNSPTRPNEWLS